LRALVAVRVRGDLALPADRLLTLAADHVLADDDADEVRRLSRSRADLALLVDRLDCALCGLGRGAPLAARGRLTLTEKATVPAHARGSRRSAA
jgi:hypothetical protein